VGAQLLGVNLEGAVLNSADMSGAQLYGSNLRGDTLLVQTNFSGAIFGPDTDLSNNLSFGSSQMQNAHILTRMVSSNVIRRVDQLELDMKALIQQQQQQSVTGDSAGHGVSGAG
jgi:uncharacterized protein YjbI with pentapeptide repeats